MSTMCYNPIKGIDDVIASKVPSWNSYYVATLRGLYDTTNETELDVSSPEKIEEAINILKEFRRNLSKKDAKKFHDAITNPVAAYSQLKAAFTVQERVDRQNMLANMFSDVVDYLASEYGVDRETAIKGFTLNETKIGGPAYIYKEVQKLLVEEMKEWAEYGHSNMVEKYNTIFKNWGALVSYANKILHETEGVNIDKGLTFATNSVSEDIESVEFVVEESARESWQEVKDTVSPYGTASSFTRAELRRLSNAPIDEEGEVDYDNAGEFVDDLQHLRTLNPIKTYQTLMDMLTGINSETDMVNILKKSNEPFIKQLLADFEANPILRTQFFIDFSKAFMPYSMETSKQNPDGSLEYSEPSLNELSQTEYFKRYSAALNSKALSSKDSIFRYEEGEAVVSETVAKELSALLKESYKETGNILQPTVVDSYSNEERKELYKVVLPALGIVLDEGSYEQISSNAKYYRNLDKALKDLPLILDKAKDGINFRKFMNTSVGNVKVYKEKIGKIFQVTEGIDKSKRVVSRARYQGNNYQSNVASSYLSRFIDTIKSFSNNKDKKGLTLFLTERFLNSHFFKDNINGTDVVLNKWLKDLLGGNMNNKDSFINNIDITRFLGDDSQKCEDFNSKKQVIHHIQKYFSTGKKYGIFKKYGWYPTFILGDSGAMKYIKAPRYSLDTIREQMFNVYLQEKNFQKELQEFKQGLLAEGKSFGSFAYMDSNMFSLLPFLNDKKYRDMIDNGNLKQSFIKALDAYMEDSYNTWHLNIESVDALAVNNKGKSVHFGNLTLYEDRSSKNEAISLHGNEAIEANLKDYFWNSKFATIQMMELMTVTPAFYAGTTDLQKRFKEIHASGNRLSLQAVDPFKGGRFLKRNSDYQTTMYFDDIKVNPEETNAEFMQVIASVFGRNSDEYNTYKNKTSLTDGQGYRTPESYRAVMGMAGKWNKECEEAFDEIQAIRAEIGNEDANEAQVKRLAELMVTFQPIKPFLFTWEDMKLGNSSFPVPTQLKYAEIMVIPELYPKGSKLRDIMSYASSNDVDVVCATTAVKVGNFGASNVAESNNIADLVTRLRDSSIHNLDYSDYVIQTNVPEHIQSSQLFATQIRKLIFANLSDVDGYGRTKYYDDYVGANKVNLGKGEVPVNAYTLNRFYISLIAANILEDFNKFKSIISNPERVRDALIQMTINSNNQSLDNIRGYSKGLEEEFELALFEGGVERETSSLLLSMFKKQVNKQKILGGSAVQVSAFGISGYSEDNNLKYVCSYDKNGNPTNVLYAEVEIPFDLSYTDAAGNKIDLEFSDWCNADGTLKLDKDGNTLIEKKFPDILNFIAYRIPSEDNYSIINCRVKKFSLKVNGGGTIRVPAQGTTIAGFDFDVDKLYFMRREFKQAKLSQEEVEKIWKEFYSAHPEVKRALQKAREESVNIQDDISAIFRVFTNSKGMQELADFEAKRDRLYKYWKEAGLEGTPEETFSEFLRTHEGEFSWEKLDTSKPSWDDSQTRVMRNNMIINLIQKRLEDPQTLRSRYTPGGFSHASAAAAYIRKLMGIENLQYDFSDPWTLVVFNQQNQIAGKLIGIFANQNANHAMASLMHKFSLKHGIAFGNHREGLTNLLNPNSLTKELLAASVDAVKDPVLNFLNLNTITADSAGMLTRLGYSFEEIGLLFNQPAIVELCRYMQDNNMSNVDTAINNFLKKRYPDNNSERMFLDIKTLEDSIKSYSKLEDRNNLKKDSSFITTQVEVLKLFREIYSASSEVGRFVTNTKFTAANAVKSTQGEMIAQQEKVINYVGSFGNSDVIDIQVSESEPTLTPIRVGLDINSPEYIMEVMKNPFGYEQAMYDANVAAVQEINRYYPYMNSTYKGIREFIRSLTISSLDGDTINDIHDYLLSYMIGLDEFSPFNPDGANKYDNSISNKEYYTKVIPLKILDLLNKALSLQRLPIFQSMETTTDSNDDIVLKIQEAGALTLTQKEDIRNSWEALLEDENLRAVAFDLYMYSYYKSGFGFGSTGFNHLAPLQLKLELLVNDGSDGGNVRTYRDFLNDVLNDNIKDVDKVHFARSFIISHSNNTKLVYEPRAEQKEYIGRKVYKNGFAESTISLDYIDDKDNVSPFIVKATKKGIIFKPAIKINGNLYIAREIGAIKGDGKMVYELYKEPTGTISTSTILTPETPSTIKVNPESSSTITPDEAVRVLDTLSTEDLIGQMLEITKLRGGEMEDIQNQRAYINKVLLENTEALVRGSLIESLIEDYKELGVNEPTTGKKIC